MAKLNIFTNQTSDLTVVAQVNGLPLAVSGIPQVDIAGTLDGATMTTEYLHSNNDLNAWVPIVDATWDAGAMPAPSLPDGATFAIDPRQLRFVLSGSGASTDISVTLTYDT